MQENATYSSDHFLCRAKVLQTGQWIQGYLYQKTNENEKKVMSLLTVLCRLAVSLNRK